MVVDIVCDVTGWFTKELAWKPGKKSIPLVTPTPAYLEIQKQLMDEAEMYAPMSWPMLIEPNDWTNERAGGYLLNEVQRGNDLVRHGNPCLRQPDTVLAFLNKLQQVAYKVNPFTYKVAQQLNERGYQLKKFKPFSALAI